MDFWISDWISGFHSGFLDFSLDFWISGFQFGFLPTVYEISFVTDPSCFPQFKPRKAKPLVSSRPQNKQNTQIGSKQREMYSIKCSPPNNLHFVQAMLSTCVARSC